MLTQTEKMLNVYEMTDKELEQLAEDFYYSNSGYPILGNWAEVNDFTDEEAIVKTADDIRNGTLEQIFEILESEQFGEYLREKDYVGIDTGGNMLLFNPSEQIKSATDNVGAFDGDNPDVRYSQGDSFDELVRKHGKRNQPIAQAIESQSQNATQPFGKNTVGAAQSNPHSYSHLQNEYGTIEEGENPTRIVDVPKKTAKK